jgi:hypothetical protein
MNKGILSIIILLLFVGGMVWLIKTPGKPGKLDAFATCIKDSGTLFYGAFWCPHCKNQKALFGSSAKLLPYIECSTPDGTAQLPVCTQAGVHGYPTWKFPNGTVESSEQTLEHLSEVTNCPLPQ